MCAEKIDLLLAQWISALIGTRTTAAGGLDEGDSRLHVTIDELVFFRLIDSGCSQRWKNQRHCLLKLHRI